MLIVGDSCVGKEGISVPIYVKTACFFSQRGKFDSERDDRELNGILQQLQSQRAEIRDISVNLSGERGATALYVIQYEAASPL